MDIAPEVIKRVKKRLDHAKVHAPRDYSAYVNDPVAFAQDVLGLPTWSRQRDLLNAVAENNRVVVRSGRKTSKSKSAAILGLWWLATREASKVFISAPGHESLKSIIWPEVKLEFPKIMDDIGPVTSYSETAPETGIVLADGRKMWGLATNTPGRIRGFSGSNFLVIIDESSDYDDAFFATLFGNLMGSEGGGKILALGNPTTTSGWYYEALKSERWTQVHISSLESPNITKLEPPIPGLANEAGIEEWAEWCGGKDSNYFRVHVLGELPSGAADAVVARTVLEEAVKRWAFTPDDGPLVIGLDVAGTGDDESVCAIRRGSKIVAFRATSGKDPIGVANWAMEVADDFKLDSSERPEFHVDGNGIGAGTSAKLRELNQDVCDIIVGEASEEPHKYRNLRTQLCFGMGAWLKTGAVPSDVKFEQETLAIRYMVNEKSIIEVEAKRLLKTRLGRSPDRFDAVMLAVYDGQNATSEMLLGREKRKSSSADGFYMARANARSANKYY